MRFPEYRIRETETARFLFFMRGFVLSEEKLMGRYSTVQPWASPPAYIYSAYNAESKKSQEIKGNRQ